MAFPLSVLTFILNLVADATRYFNVYKDIFRSDLYFYQAQKQREMEHFAYLVTCYKIFVL